MYDAINVLVAAGVVTKDNNKIELLMQHKSDFDSQVQSKLVKKLSTIERLNRKLAMLDKISKRNLELGKK